MTKQIVILSVFIVIRMTKEALGMSNFLYSADSEPLKKETLGMRLKQLRKDKGVSQQEIANLFRVTRPCVCYWETGKRLPDYQTLISLSEFYDVSIDYLVGRCNNKHNVVETPAEQYHSQDILDLSLLVEGNKKTVRDLYQFLLDKQKIDSAAAAIQS